MWSSVKVIVLVVLLGCLGCGTQQGGSSIRTPREYSDALRQATELSREPLAHFSAIGSVNADDEGKLIKAQELYEALAEYQPTLFTLHFALGAIRHALGNYADAEQSFRQALTLMPATPTPDAAKIIADTHFGLATVLIDRANYSESRSEAKLALEYQPENANYLTTLAAAEIQLKETASARAHLKKALSIEPGHRRAQDLLSLLQR